LKKFNTSDSAGILFAKKLNIKVGIITGENTQIVKNRADKLKIDYLFQGISNKIEVALKLCQELNIELSDVAYIGDDIGDLQLLKAVGFSSAPKNASSYIQSAVHFVTSKNGGEGAFREFVENILSREIDLDAFIEENFG
jgi:3-deoxy-D-manno-octulosonate 8-phosphate phosphatase (KDO 8-P phosphatase)